ncbi:MAG: hypothetical protein ACYS83_07575 [Planctomycetota bacterium]|jgi:uncharacterized protein YjeT (DUF2065 family)
MVTAVRIVGIIIALAGVVYLLKPSVMKWLMEFFKQGRRLYFAGLIRFALAVIFFSAYRDCDQRWVIFAFGILFLISGMLIFVIPLEKLKAYIGWWQKQSLILLRVMALIAVAIGAVIIIFA